MCCIIHKYRKKKKKKPLLNFVSVPVWFFSFAFNSPNVHFKESPCLEDFVAILQKETNFTDRKLPSFKTCGNIILKAGYP